jgi:hypothetical protein
MQLIARGTAARLVLPALAIGLSVATVVARGPVSTPARGRVPGEQVGVGLAGAATTSVALADVGLWPHGHAAWPRGWAATPAASPMGNPAPSGAWPAPGPTGSMFWLCRLANEPQDPRAELLAPALRRQTRSRGGGPLPCLLLPGREG